MKDNSLFLRLNLYLGIVLSICFKKRNKPKLLEIKKSQKRPNKIQEKQNCHQEWKEIINKSLLNKQQHSNKEQRKFNQSQKYTENHQTLINFINSFNKDYKERESKIRQLNLNNLILTIDQHLDLKQLYRIKQGNNFLLKMKLKQKEIKIIKKYLNQKQLQHQQQNSSSKLKKEDKKCRKNANSKSKKDYKIRNAKKQMKI